MDRDNDFNSIFFICFFNGQFRNLSDLGWVDKCVVGMFLTTHKRVNYKIPIGTLEVIHTEEDSAVALRKELYDTAKDPIFDINNFMIGDHIAINLD